MSSGAIKIRSTSSEIILQQRSKRNLSIVAIPADTTDGIGWMRSSTRRRDTPELITAYMII